MLFNVVGNVVLAQCDFNKQKEIKLSGMFYYGESINADTSVAKKLARTELINQIANVYLNNRKYFSFDSVLVVSNIKYCLSSYGNRYLAIAYVGKDVCDSNRGNGLNIVKVNFTESEQITGSTSALYKTRRKLIQKNVIDSLSEIHSADDLSRNLLKYASRNRLVFSTKESLVDNVGDCYIFIVDRDKKYVIGCLNFEKPFRRNLIDDSLVRDYRSEFPNSNFIWVYVY